MKTGTASRAAETLGVTQPAVSRGRWRNLGTGRRLLPCLRAFRNRLVPTPEARQLYRDVETTFRGIDTLRASAARLRDRGSGGNPCGDPCCTGRFIRPARVRRFREKHPTVRVTLHVLPSRQVRDLVASGQFDLGLARRGDRLDGRGASAGLRRASALCHTCRPPAGGEAEDRACAISMTSRLSPTSPKTGRGSAWSRSF